MIKANIELWYLMYMNMVPSTVEVPYTKFLPLLEKMYLMKNKINDNNWMNTQIEYEPEVYYLEWIQTWGTSTEGWYWTTWTIRFEANLRELIRFKTLMSEYESKWVNHLFFFKPSPLNSSANFDAGLRVSRSLILLGGGGTTTSGGRVDVEARWKDCGRASLCCPFECVVLVDFSDFPWCSPPSEVLSEIWNFAPGLRISWLSDCLKGGWISRSCSCWVSERSWCPVRFCKSWDAWREYIWSPTLTSYDKGPDRRRTCPPVYFRGPRYCQTNTCWPSSNNRLRTVLSWFKTEGSWKLKIASEPEGE